MPMTPAEAKERQRQLDRERKRAPGYRQRKSELEAIRAAEEAAMAEIRNGVYRMVRVLREPVP